VGVPTGSLCWITNYIRQGRALPQWHTPAIAIAIAVARPLPQCLPIGLSHWPGVWFSISIQFHSVGFRLIPPNTHIHMQEQWHIRWQFSLKFRTAAKVRLACFKRLHQWQIPLLAASGKSKVASAVINVKSALPSVLASSSTERHLQTHPQMLFKHSHGCRRTYESCEWIGEIPTYSCKGEPDGRVHVGATLRANKNLRCQLNVRKMVRQRFPPWSILLQPYTEK